MLQDEVSRYSLNLIKINLKYANKPKIYNTQLARPIETKAIEDRIKSLQNKNQGLGAVQNKVDNGGMSSLQFDPRITGLVSSGVREYVAGSSDISSGNDLNKIIERVTSEVIKNLTGGAIPVGNSVQTPNRTEYQFYDKKNVVVQSEGNSEYDPQGQGLITIDMTAGTVYPISFVIADKIDNGIPQPKKLAGFTDIMLVFADNTTTVKILQTTYRTSGLDDGSVYFEINDNEKQSIKKFYESGIKNFSIVGASNGKQFQIYSGVYEISNSKFMQMQNESIIKAKMDKQKEKALSALNDTPKPQTILDTSVATTNTASTSTAENLGNAPTPKGGG